MNKTFVDEPSEPTDRDERGQIPFPTTWRAALGALFAARIAIIRSEAGAAVDLIARRAIASAGAAVLALFFWPLVLAGSIGAIAALTEFPWYWITLILAGAHLLVIAALIGVARSAGRPAFPVTQSEFHKDLEWLRTQKAARK